MCEPDGECVSLHVMDGDEGFLVLADQAPAVVQPHAQAQSKPGFHCGGHGRKLGHRNAAGTKGLLNHSVDVFSVKLLCHHRNYSSWSSKTKELQCIGAL